MYYKLVLKLLFLQNLVIFVCALDAIKEAGLHNFGPFNTWFGVTIELLLKKVFDC